MSNGAKKTATASKKASESNKSRGMSTAERDKLPDSVFAFPKERKEPLTDARHVRNAIARFDQVEGVSEAERARAWKRILAAAKKHGVRVEESDWRELMDGEKPRKSTAKGEPKRKPTVSRSSR
jgi:hypothetical protein